MAEYFSKHTGADIDGAISDVINRTSSLFPSGSSSGDKILTSKGAYEGITKVSAIYRHEISGDGFQCVIYSDCPSGVTSSLIDFLSLFDVSFPYTIFRISGSIIDGDSIVGIAPDSYGYYSENSFIICIGNTTNLYFRRITEQEFSGQISHEVQRFYPDISG